MPKELLYSAETLRGDKAVVEHIAVGWEKDRGVQLGVAAGPAATMRVDGGSTGGITDSLWMDLDREGINRLIRSLRKARDSAYGADA